MKAIIKTFPSASGDCVFFQLEENAKRYVIMIDCGRYTQEIKTYVEINLEKHIDLLVATHIDNDHIDGLVEMLIQTPEVSINKILFNCNQRWRGQVQFSDSIEQDLQTIRKNLPARPVIDNGKIRAGKAVTLAEKIVVNKALLQAWVKEYITTQTPSIALDEHNDRFGKITILSPTPERIEKLNNRFKGEYVRLTKHILDNGECVKGKETLFELVERVIDMKRKNYEFHATQKINTSSNLLDGAHLAEAFEFIPQGVTDENQASIAIMWEYGEKKVLFMGDAEPEDIVKRIKEVYGDKQLLLEGIKVSHHGSKHSTSHALMKMVDSGHFFFTGGNLKDKPSLEAIMKTVNRSGTKKRVLHFNNPDNINVKALSTEQGAEVCNRFNFVIDNSNEYQFEY